MAQATDIKPTKANLSNSARQTFVRLELAFQNTYFIVILRKNMLLVLFVCFAAVRGSFFARNLDGSQVLTVLVAKNITVAPGAGAASTATRDASFNHLARP